MPSSLPSNSSARVFVGAFRKRHKPRNHPFLGQCGFLDRFGSSLGVNVLALFQKLANTFAFGGGVRPLDDDDAK
jgi:hypothetical protein